MAICTRCRSYQNPITNSFGRCDECAADDAAQPAADLSNVATLDYLSTAEAARALSVEPVTVRSYMARGIIIATKFGRDWLIARSEIERVRANPPQRPGRPKRAA